jgi:hypothetical protein
MTESIGTVLDKGRVMKIASIPSVGFIALVLLVTLGVGGSSLSQAQDGSLRNCPPAGKWSIAVWEGQSGIPAADALATCGGGAVAAAYSLDPQTGAWSRWFAGKPEVSNLLPLSNLQGVMALGAAGGPSTTPTPAATTKIAFTSARDGNDEIYVMNADGTDPRNLTNDRARDSNPAWSPDGTKIAFVSDRDGNDEIYVMNADGSGQTRMTNSPGQDYYPAWSPDGSHIAFSSDHATIIVEVATGRVVTGPDVEWSVDVSPDSRHIAYLVYLHGGGGGDWRSGEELWLLGIDGTGRTRLGEGGYPVWRPAAMP